MTFEFKIIATRKIDNTIVTITVEHDSWMNGDCAIHADEDAMYTVYDENAVKDIYAEEENICKYCLYADFEEISSNDV